MWWYPFLSDFTKKNNCLLTRRVCCFYQSNYCIRVCISHQSDCCIRVYISYWSDFFIRLCILHQSYHSIWISCTNYSAWVLFSCKWCHGIRGLCSKSGIDHKFCAYVISVMIVAFARALSSEVEIFGIWKVCSYFFVFLFLRGTYATDSEFSRHSPIFDFSRSKSDFSYLEINPIGF